MVQVWLSGLTGRPVAAGRKRKPANSPHELPVSSYLPQPEVEPFAVQGMITKPFLTDCGEFLTS
jgi:hypothetical protein